MSAGGHFHTFFMRGVNAKAAKGFFGLIYHFQALGVMGQKEFDEELEKSRSPTCGSEAVESSPCLIL